MQYTYTVMDPEPLGRVVADSSNEHAIPQSAHVIQSEAIVKADALLDECLTATQRRMLREKGFFEVKGSLGERGGVYQICRGQVQNVYLTIKGERLTRLCAHPAIRVPDGDAMLAQKLMIETDEEAFWRIANAERVGRGG
jgi:hypothetical protein